MDLSLSGIVRRFGPVTALAGVDLAVAEGERIFAMARQPKAFIPLLSSDHLLTSRQASAQTVGILVDWFSRTL